MKLRSNISIIFIFLAVFCMKASERPLVVTIEGQPRHVQGMVFDETAGKMYFSFTTRFVVTDLEGNITGTVDRIHGHLGAMTFDPVRRRVYASLECKDDQIGASISRSLGEEGFNESSFYIAEIDVDRVDRQDVEESEVIRRIEVVPADEDYAAKVSCGGEILDHRYACSGIDGVTIAPAFGKPDGKRMFLYVAYGIYGDVGRTDNDYQVLLRYPLGKRKARPVRYFVKTGNTSWGVQNLAWDRSSGLMLMAVYKGAKKDFPNHSLYAVDMGTRPKASRLDGVPYQKSKVLTLALAGEGWDSEYGSTGMCSLGDGLFYLAENFSRTQPDGRKSFCCNARLYMWDGQNGTAFRRIGSD